METQPSPEKTGQTKSPRRLPARITAGLDAASATVAPLTERWDAASKRRLDLRTPEHLKELIKAQREYNAARSVERQADVQRRMARQGSKNPLSSIRRAARTAAKAAATEKRAAKVDLKKARRNYPATLARRAVQAHAAHSVPAGLATYLLSTPADWTVWPAGTSVGLITAHAVTLWLGHRQPSTGDVLDDGLSIEERQLMERLNPSWWVQHAVDRGLAGTVSTPPAITPAGIECDVRLDDEWTVKKLRAATDSVRALLGARTDLPMLVGPGSRGGWAILRLRTRSAAPDGAIPWRPGDAFGVDTTTGEDVHIELGNRMLIAGMSGAGKSTASRPLLHEASEGPTNVLVIIDLKKVEGRLWDHRARVAYTPEQVVSLVQELVDEMNERLDVLPKGEATLVPTERRPRITVVVDEGAEVVSSCTKVKVVTGHTEKGAPIVETLDALDGLDSIARMGRAACVDLWWMTQSPTYGDGVPRQIAKQLGVRLGLAVESPSEARVVFGESAQEKGWKADELPMPGVALLRDGTRSPDPVKVRYMDDQTVIGLPDQRIWGRVEEEAASVARPPLRLVKSPPAPAETEAAESPASVEPETNRDRVAHAIAAGARTAKAVGEATGLNKGTVSREIKKLVADGAVHRAEDGTLAVQGETEATA